MDYTCEATLCGTTGLGPKNKDGETMGNAASLFETSLTFELSTEVSARVKLLMAHPLLAGHTDGLSQPHVTALFMGFLSGSMLEALKPELAAPPHKVIDAGLTGWGFFRRDDGTCNIHIRVRPEPDLVAVHQWALGVCRRFFWTPPADVSADNYVPHITVADGLLDPDATLGELKGVALPSRVTLSRLQLRAHPWHRPTPPSVEFR
jgi:2'-5' RNA ligase